MKQTIFLLSISLISATVSFAQKRVVENAAKVAVLVPAIGVQPLEDRKACAITNKSATRTISVRIEESTTVDGYLQKRIKVIEKIGPRQQKFVGYAGCDVSVLGRKCQGYKIQVAYYDDATSVAPGMNPASMKGSDAVASK